MTPSRPASLARATIAFLSMEIGLETGMRCYSGGLGVLAGDYALAAADLGLPMVFISMACRDGYVRQTIDSEGRQHHEPDPWDPAEWATPLPVVPSITIEGREVRIRSWLRELEGVGGSKLPVLLLDTDVEENDPSDRAITDRLYGGDVRTRIRQEAVLGLGGKAVLDALGLDIARYHLNEGHAALLPLALLAEGMDRDAIRRASIFTTHTPIPAGHDRFAMDLVRDVVGGRLADTAALLFEGSTELDMTRLALELSGWVNGVSERHAEVSRGMFPDHEVHAVTNGVHLGRWAHPAAAALFDSVAPAWRRDPSGLSRFAEVDDDVFWSAHRRAKQELVEDVAARTGHRLDPELPILGYARRMTPYKRADLLFSHLVRLLKIAERHPFQVLLAGKAHPEDKGGQALIHRLHEIARSCGSHLPVLFVPGYDIEVAARMVAGCDVWLNTPEPPLEASGTSGMKAAINGVPNLSILDGWWIEGCEHGRNGWGIAGNAESPAADADRLLDCLEHDVLPLWHDDRRGWIEVMKHSVASLAPKFSACRPMREYVDLAYGEAADASR
jgi:starch phosphorylase